MSESYTPPTPGPTTKDATATARIKKPRSVKASVPTLCKHLSKVEGVQTFAPLAQTFAKVGIYADQRIGEILRELPTRQGARNDITSVTTVTKVQAEKQAGVSHKTAIDLQAMAANPEVVEAVIAKAKERMQDPMQTFAEGQTGTSRDKAAARHHPPT